MFKFLKLNQRGILHLIPLLILLGGIVAGVYLVQKTQVFRPKASTETIFWVPGSQSEVDSKDNCVQQKDGSTFTTCPKVKFKLAPTFDIQPERVSTLSRAARLLGLPAAPSTAAPRNLRPSGPTPIGSSVGFLWTSVEAKRYRLIIKSYNGEANQYNNCNSGHDFSQYFYCSEGSDRLITQPGTTVNGDIFQDKGDYSWWVDALGENDQSLGTSTETHFTVNKLSPPPQGGQTPPVAPAAQNNTQADLACQSLSIRQGGGQIVPLQPAEKKTARPGEEIILYATGNRNITDEERTTRVISWYISDNTSSLSPNFPPLGTTGNIWFAKWAVPDKTGRFHIGTKVYDSWQDKCDVNFDVVGTKPVEPPAEADKEKVACTNLNAYLYWGELNSNAGEISTKNQLLAPEGRILLVAGMDKEDKRNSIKWSVEPEVGGFSNQDWNKIDWRVPERAGTYLISISVDDEYQSNCTATFRVARGIQPPPTDGSGSSEEICPADKIKPVEYWQCGGTVGLEDKTIGTAYYIERTENECSGIITFKTIESKERVNAPDCPQPQDSGTPPPPAEKSVKTIAGFKFAENEKELDNKDYSSWAVSSAKEVFLTHTFSDSTPGTKVIYAKFQFSDGSEEKAFPFPIKIELKEQKSPSPSATTPSSDSCTGIPDVSNKWLQCSPADLMKKFSSNPGQLAELSANALEKFRNEDLLVIGRASRGGLHPMLSRLSAARLTGLSPFEGSGFGLDILKQLPQSKINELPAHIQDQISGKSTNFPQTTQRVVDEQKCRIEGCGFCPSTTDRCGNTVYKGSCDYSTCRSMDDTYTCTSSVNNNCQGTYRCGISCVGL